jgi:proton-translocating NADH-quinone oxidoreductase chain N
MDAIPFMWMFAIPLILSPVVYLAGRLGTPENSLWKSPAFFKGRSRSLLVRVLALLALLATWVPFVLAVRTFLAGGRLEFEIESIWLRVDAISLLLAAMVLTLGTLVVLFSGPYMAGEVGEEKFYAMLLAMVGLMIGLGCAGDLFNLWVWFEGMAVSSYLLVAFYREQPASLEAGMKYLVQSAVGSVLVLMGIALVLANSGTLDLDSLGALSASSNRLVPLAAVGLFIIGFGVKAALVPLHTWLPDAHSQAPSGISAMLSGVVIEAGLIAMLRALGAVMHPEEWRILFLGFGALNMVFGNLMAMRQTVVKRMLAYSSLSHIGYILLGLGVALYAHGGPGAQGAMFHLFTHMLMKGLAFLSVGALIYGLYLQNGSHNPLMVSDLAGTAQKYPIVALSLSIALLGLGGLPPLAGFMSKWQIFVGGFSTQNGWIMALMVFMALNSVLSLGYYAPLVNLMYRNTPSEQILAGKPLPWTIILPLILLALAVVVLGLVPGSMDWLTVPAGQRLISMFWN